MAAAPWLAVGVEEQQPLTTRDGRAGVARERGRAGGRGADHLERAAPETGGDSRLGVVGQDQLVSRAELEPSQLGDDSLGLGELAEERDHDAHWRPTTRGLVAQRGRWLSSPMRSPDDTRTRPRGGGGR